jgi:hypothetical protein
VVHVTEAQVQSEPRPLRRRGRRNATDQMSTPNPHHKPLPKRRSQ